MFFQNKIILLFITILGFVSYLHANPYMKISSDRFGSLNSTIANNFCKEANKLRSNSCLSYNSSGYIENINNLLNGKSNLVFISTELLGRMQDNQILSIENSAEKASKIKIVLKIYPETLNVLVKNNNSINDIQDLSNKKILIDSDNAWLYFSSPIILRFVKYDLNTSYGTYINKKENIDQLCNGDIDALVMASAHIDFDIRDAFATCDLKLIGNSSSLLAYLIKSHTDNKMYSIDQKIYNATYKGPEIKVIGSYINIVSTEGTPDYVVENFLKNFFIIYESTFKNYDDTIFKIEIPQTSLDKESGLEYHNGAIKYFNINK